MRGFYPDPSRLNTRKGERGWLQRQEEAQRRMAGADLNGEPEAWRHVDAERQQMYAEREREALAQAEARRVENRKLRVTCPCCGAGAVSVDHAELILAALDRIPEDENKRLKAQREKDVRTCPVCDTGKVNGEMAERIVVALEKLPADRMPSMERMQILLAVAMNVTYHGVYALRPSNGAHHPRRAAPVGDVVIPAAEMPAPIMEPVRKYVLPPHLLDE